MLAKVEVVARAQGVKKLTLCTAKAREDLIRLYRKVGFVVAREGPPTHNKDSHLRVHMEKHLV